MDEDRSTTVLTQAATATYNGDAFQRVIYSESHDEVANGKARVTTEVNANDPDGWHAKKRSTLAAALAFTSPGVPMLFQGQEILEDEWFRDTDPIEWEKAKSFSGVLRLYRDLIHLRRNSQGQTKGLTGSGFAILYEHHDDRLIAIHRWYHGGIGDDVVVLFNLSTVSKQNISIPLPKAGKWQLKFNSDWKGYSQDFGSESSEQFVEITQDGESVPLVMPPYSVQILVLTASSH